MNIAIIGAGLGGLTAALALQRLGQTVTVYERAAQLGEVGAGITLHPNATKVMAYVGLIDALVPNAIAVQHSAIKHFKTNAVLVETKKGAAHVEKFGANLYQIHRADVSAALEAAVRKNDPRSIRAGYGLVDFHQTPNNVVMTFENGVTQTADLMIGCDGIKSVVRTKAFSPAPPEFTGRIAYRGIIPRSAVTDEMIWPGSGIWIGPGRTFGKYLMRSGTLVNYVATVRKDEWAAEGWNTPATHAEMLADFAGWHTHVQELIKRTPLETAIKWGLFAHAPLKTWCQARVAVMGDAAHPMLPFMGQGAAMAMEDGVILARCIAETPDPIEALKRFERARIERATFVQLESTAKAERWESDEPEKYNPQNHRNEDTLGLVAYDAATAPI